MGIYTVNASIKPTVSLAIFKKDRNFFISFILYLNIFVDFKTIQYYKTYTLYYIILYINITSYIPQILQIALTVDVCQVI